MDNACRMHDLQSVHQRENDIDGHAFLDPSAFLLHIILQGCSLKIFHDHICRVICLKEIKDRHNIFTVGKPGQFPGFPKEALFPLLILIRLFLKIYLDLPVLRTAYQTIWKILLDGGIFFKHRIPG